MRGGPVISRGSGRRRWRCFYFRSILLIPGLGFGTGAELLRDTIDGNGKSWDGVGNLWAWDLGGHTGNTRPWPKAWRGMAFCALGITTYNGRTPLSFNTASFHIKSS